MDVVRRWLAPPVVALLCCAALAGCADDATPTPSEETAVDETSPPTTPAGPNASPAVTQSVEDLAITLGIDAGAVEVVSVEGVTWRNGSRGCAQPGMSYTQALVEGSRITLRADGRSYEYHAGGSQPPARCDKPTE